jgi:hypothetical protein
MKSTQFLGQDVQSHLALDSLKDIWILTDAGSECQTLLYQVREDSLNAWCLSAIPRGKYLFPHQCP